MTTLVAAPAFATDMGAKWLAYEDRLRCRLDDAGGGRFDVPAEQEIYRLTNAARVESGAGVCAWSDELALTARAHAADLAARDYIEHVSPDGFDPSHRVSIMARRMIGSASENIAYRRAAGAVGGADLMGIWRKSRPHWTNLLNPAHARIGVGVVVVGERTYAVGLYSKPDGVLGAPLPFRIGDEADLVGPVSHAVPSFDGYEVSDPVDLNFRPRIGASPPKSLAPGVYQLRPQRRIGDYRYEVLWGPIFVRT